MNKELLQQTLIERCRKDAADRDCPYFARDTLTKAADMLATIAQPVPPATVQGEPVAAMIDMSEYVEQMPDGSYRPIYKTGLFTTTPQPASGEVTDDDIQNLNQIAAQLETDDHFIQGAWARAFKNRLAATSAKPEGDAKDAEIDALLDDADDWARYVEAHFAPMTLRAHLKRAIKRRAAIASQKGRS